ncbi:CocE/NonD family hydrolase [Halomarina halobia]|uniref:CocE/NonD family hydrolase n=1 Tax=Halomarina halobia TaxID=3033386 RepID=A0ABD6A6V2_9EURY|nr:CocE/NonD family hydrolase [Halomarina sp. PSR21]
MRDRTTRRAVLGALAAAATGATADASVRTAAATGSGYSGASVEIDSFDGTTLSGRFTTPDDEGPFPSVLMTHGWGGDHGSERVRRLTDLYASNGYAVLAYDSRGFGESGGRVGVDGPNEVRDVGALLDWLAARPAVATDAPGDPRVGMDNVSYAGGIQLEAAAEEPRLDAVVPRWAWNDLPHSLAPNGVIKAGWDGLLYATGVTGSRGLTSGDGWPTYEDVENGLDREVHGTILYATATNEFPDEGRAYYAARSPGRKLDEVETPTLLISGWPDTLFVPNEALWTFEGLRERGVETRLVLFQGGHTLTDTAGAEQRRMLDDLALAWLDEHVAGRGAADLPPVTYYEIQTGRFRRTNALPPANADARTIDLADAAALDSTTIANSPVPTSTSQLSPVNGDHVPGTAAHFDVPVERDLEVLGAPRLSLCVSPLGPDAQLFAKFYHVSDGDATLVGNQVTPLRLREAGERTVAAEMVAIQRRLRPGDTLRFTVATTDAGFYNSREAVGVTLHHAPGESTVEVPVLARRD